MHLTKTHVKTSQIVLVVQGRNVSLGERTYSIAPGGPFVMRPGATAGTTKTAIASPKERPATTREKTSPLAQFFSMNTMLVNTIIAGTFMTPNATSRTKSDQQHPKQ